MSVQNDAALDNLKRHASQQDINESLVALIKRLHEIVMEQRVSIDLLSSNPSSPEVQAKTIDYEELSKHIDVDDVAQQIDNNEIADCLEGGNLKSEIVSDVADYYGQEGIAEEVASNIDTNEVVNSVIESLDYERLAKALVVCFMAKEDK